MKPDETAAALADPRFLDRLYCFAYRRCECSHDAEDLASEVALNILNSAQKTPEVENFYAFAWKIARRVYADFCAKRRRASAVMSIEGAGGLSDLPDALGEAGLDAVSQDS